MNNSEILRIAMEQSARDIGCEVGDFLAEASVVVPLRPGPDAKRYYRPPIGCNFVSYGNNVVAAATEELSAIVREYVDRFSFYHCFETPNLHWLNERLAEKGQAVCFMAEYFLPDVGRLSEIPCSCALRVLEKGRFDALYLPQWSNALCADRRQLDVLCVSAYAGNALAGLAGCSADAEEMWQIGVDVLPEYRQRGIASAMTSRLALEILRRGKAPFYCAAWSNIRSVRNAIRSGFVPAWVEMTVKPLGLIDELNA